MSYETGQPIFAQIGDVCYLCRYQDTDADSSMVVTDVHWISRKGSTNRAEIEFHRELGVKAAGCEVIFRGHGMARLPSSAFTSHWPWELPMADVGDPNSAEPDDE